MINIGERFDLEGLGMVRVVDFMGSDDAIVRAARISYGAGTKTVREDRALIRYLMRHRHTSPFEHCELSLHIRVPMDVQRQWIRHRTASVNEYSTRYSEAIEEMATTLPGSWRLQSSTNKQGSGMDFVEDEVGLILSEKEKALQEYSRSVYLQRLELGVAREQARKDLPLSTFTEAYWKIDLHNLLHFLSLRMDPHAQYEIRQFANVIGGQIVSRWVPLTWSAFLDYRLNAVTLSVLDMELLARLLPEDAALIAEDSGEGRESKEYAEKIRKIMDHRNG